MRKAIAIITFVLLVSLMIFSSASADLPGAGWWSAMFAQNVGAGSDGGTLRMTAYSSSDQIESVPYNFGYGQTLVYDPGKSPNYDQGNVIGFERSLPSDFTGSVVLSSSVPVSAISEIANYSNGPVGGNGRASAMYQAFNADMAKNVLRVTTVKNNYSNQSTTIFVQAAGQDADVVITYNMNDGNYYTQTTTIPANQMFMFDPANAGVPSTDCGFDPNSSPCFGAATIVSSTGRIAGAYVEHPYQGTPAYLALSTRAQTEDDEDFVLYGPSVKHTYKTGSGTGITGDAIMNVGQENALVQISLRVTKLGNNAPGWVKVGDVFTDTEVIEPGKSVVFSKWDNNLGGMPAGTYAAAVYTSLDTNEYDPQPLIGASNDAKTLSSLPGGKGKSVYKLFAASSLTDRCAAPMVTEFEGGLTGALTVQNVGSESDTIHFVFYEYGTDNTYEFWTKEPLPSNEAINSWGVSMNTGGYFENDGTWDWSVLDDKQFSAIIFSETGQLINCLAFENAPSGNYDIRNYEAFNID